MNIIEQYNTSRKKAQSLVETAIFGGVFLFILGVLVSYGLKYNFQQRTSQHAFRKALASASRDMREATYFLVRDKHIPSPSDPFGVGSAEGFSGSAIVVRNYRIDKTADTKEELPRITMEFQGNDSRKETFYLAAIREENVGSSGDEEVKKIVEKYKEIYGGSNIKWDEDSGVVTIIDPYSGESIDYGSAVRICRMITDKDVCAQQCEEGRWSGEEGGAYEFSCEEVCAVSINTPWYCDKLEELFAFANLGGIIGGEQIKPKAMGIQPEIAQVKERNDTLTVNQQPQGKIISKDDFNWSFTTTREVIYHPYGDESGSYTSKSISTIKGRNDSNEWQTSY